MKLLRKFIWDTDGQDLIEYALLAATISVTLIAAMSLAKNALNSEFNTVATSITAAS